MEKDFKKSPPPVLPSSPTPWFQQLVKDIASLDTLDGCYCLPGRIKDNPWSMFVDTSIGEDFCRLNLNELRAKHQSVSYHHLGVIECDCKLENGEKCGRLFKTVRGYNRHVTVKHKLQDSPSMYVLNNVCPWCMSILSTARNAKYHVNKAFGCGVCNTDMGLQMVDMQDTDCICPKCEQEFESFDEYARHVRDTHMPPPQHIILDPNEILFR
jgi:hypothetical protein